MLAASSSPTVAKKCDSPLKKLRKLFRTNSKGSYELEPDSYFNYNDDGRQSPQLYNVVRHQLNLIINLLNCKSKLRRYKFFFG